MVLNRYQCSFLVLLAVLVALAVWTARLKTDISAFIIAGENAEEILLASEIQSGALSRRTILSISSLEKKPIPRRFIDELTVALRALPGVADVWKAGETRELIKAVEELYLPYGAQLYSRDPNRDLKSLFSKQGLADRAAVLKQALLSPASEIVKKVAQTDPLLLIFNGFKTYQPFQSGANQQSAYVNLLLESERSGLDAAAQTQIQRQIKTVFARQAQQSQADGLTYQLDMTGVPVFAAATQSMLEKDIALISTLSSIALALLFYWIFRSFSVFFWVSCLLVTVFAATVLVINLIFGSIHTMTLAVGSTLVGVCVDYPIHALVHAQSADREQRRRAIAKIWPSMLVGAITTSVGYVALGLSGYPGFQQVAVYAGTGIFVSLLLTRHALPNLIAGNKTPSSRMALPWLWIKFCARFRPALLLILVPALTISAISLQSLQWLQDLQQLTPELDYLKIKDQEIRSHMTGIEPGRFILVSAATTESALQQAEQVYRILDQLKQQGSLTDYFGLYPWLLSQKQQQQNAQLLTAMLTGAARQDWHAALAGQGLSVARLGQLNYPVGNILTIKQILQSPVGKLLDNQIVINEKQTLIMIWLGEHQPDALQKALANWPHVHYFSQRDLLNKLAIDYQERAELMVLAGFVFITALLTWRYKSPLKAVLTLIPALSATLIILAVWSAAGEPLSFLHLVGILLVISICDDFAIFYQENPGGDIVLTYQAMAASMLTSALGFGCLLAAQTALLKTLAAVVTGGVLLGFLLCPIIIRQSAVNNEKSQPH